MHMDESRWERYGAASGVVFVVLLVAATFVVPAPPHIDAPTAKIVRYITNHRQAILTSQMLGTLAVLSFVWFLGHLRHVLQRAEGGAEALSPIVYASGLVLASAAVVSVLPLTVLVFMRDSAERLGNPAVVRALWDTNQALFPLLGVLVALFVGTAAVAMVRRELLAPALGWAGMAVAAANMTVGIAGFYVTSYVKAWTIVGLVSFLAFAAWILVSSAVMIRQPEVERATTREPVFVS
jgi:hypothetical protein